MDLKWSTVNGSEVVDGPSWIAAPVPDGWIVALDFGESGGKVMRVGRDGAKQIDISNEQIQSLIGTLPWRVRNRIGGFGESVSAEQFDRNFARVRWKVANTGRKPVPLQ